MILCMITSPLDGRTQHEFTQIDEKQILFHLLLQTREGCHSCKATSGVVPSDVVTINWNCRRRFIYGKWCGIS